MKQLVQIALICSMIIAAVVAVVFIFVLPGEPETDTQPVAVTQTTPATQNEVTGNRAPTPQTTADSVDKKTIDIEIENLKNNSRFVITASESSAETTINGNTYRVVRESGELQLFLNNEIYANGKTGAEKIKIKKDGDAYLTFKMYSDKMKIQIADSSNVWQIKDKEDKYKVYLNDESRGKVKYYPDNGKTKAKDADNNTIASTKGFSKLNPALGALFIEPETDSDDEIRAFIMLSLMVMDF